MQAQICNDGNVSFRYSLKMGIPSSKFLERGITFGISLSYLSAFSSMYCQINGMQSPDGLISIQKRGSANVPVYFHLFGTRPDIGCDVVCISGMFLSALGVINRAARTKIDLVALWYLYLQMEAEDPPLLKDAGFVASIIAPLNRNRNAMNSPLKRHSTALGLALCRWLLFNLIFESGVGKV